MLCDLSQKSGSTPDVGLFNTGPSSARGRDRVRMEQDGKHKTNLQDLNCGFRFPPWGAGALYESAVQPAAV